MFLKLLVSTVSATTPSPSATAITYHQPVAVPAGITPEGLPIGVQVVGQPFTEGRLLAVATTLERALGGYRRPPEP